MERLGRSCIFIRFRCRRSRWKRLCRLPYIAPVLLSPRQPREQTHPLAHRFSIFRSLLSRSPPTSKPLLFLPPSSSHGESYTRVNWHTTKCRDTPRHAVHSSHHHLSLTLWPTPSAKLHPTRVDHYALPRVPLTLLLYKSAAHGVEFSSRYVQTPPDFHQTPPHLESILLRAEQGLPSCPLPRDFHFFEDCSLPGLEGGLSYPPRLKLNGEEEVRAMFSKLTRRRRRGEVCINTYEKRFHRSG